MMFLKSALTLVLASSASAFFVPNRVAARPFVSSHQVSLSSEPTVSTDAAAEPEENAAAPPAVEEVSASEEAAPVKKVFEQKDRHTIYIGNLPFGMTLNELREAFQEHVECGYINMPRNEETGEIKGFAFIDVPSEEDIVKAVDAMNGKEMGERPLRVSKVLPKGQIRSKKTEQIPNKNKLFVGNLSFQATADDLKELFGEYGELTDVYLPVNAAGGPRGFAFITCAEGQADIILEKCNGIEFMGRTLAVNPPLAPGDKKERRDRPTKTNRKKLYVGNLSFYTVEETLYDVFEEFGKVHDAYIPIDNERGGSRGFGFVTMDDEAALEAIDGLDGCEIDGRIIAVNEAQVKSRRGPPPSYNDEDADEEESP